MWAWPDLGDEAEDDRHCRDARRSEAVNSGSVSVGLLKSSHPVGGLAVVRLRIVPQMRIEVLGPLRVTVGGSEVSLGRPQQRLVLGLLVEAAGRVVTTDQLIDRVWGDDVPHSARKTVQVHVSKLRKALDDPAAIETVGGGYRLSGCVESDVEDFERLIAVGRRALTNRPEEASAVLRQALGMWRGPPYADLRDEQALQAEIGRIEELRLTALEDRLVADIAAGGAADAVAELDGLTGRYPLRERLQALQMTALYRTGRQVEALANYRKFRNTLAEGYGLDPSAELEELELAILRQDPDLGPAPQHHLRSPLPARYSSFVGRDADVADVRGRLSEHRLVTITGAGGIGKSSLAVEAARELAEAVDVAYVDVESVQAGDVAVATARALGLMPSSAEDAEALISRVTAERSSMLVLDGCEHAVASVARMADGLLRANRRLRLLVTSREALSVPGESLLSLDPLERGARSPAVELFLDRVGVDDVDEEQLGVAAAICDRLDGIPLAIELAAARARSMPLPEVAARLDRQVDLLVDRRGSMDRHASIAVALDWSYESLPRDRREALRSLSVFRSGFDLGAARHVLEVEDAAEILADLVATSLLPQPSPKGRYRMLEPIRQYAWALAEAAGETDTLAHRHADWAVQLARYCRDNRHTASQLAVYERAAIEHSELLAAIQWSLSGDASHAVEIVAALGRLWYAVGIDQQLRVLMLAAVEHPAVTPSAALAVAMSHTGFAWYLEDPESPSVALVEQAVEMARGIGDDGAIGMTLTRLAGIVGEGLGDHQRGLALEFEGYELLERSGHPDAVQEPYNLAQRLAAVGRVEEAADLLRESIDVAARAGFTDGAATAQYGHYLIAQSQFAEGIEALERGIALLERLGRQHTLISQKYHLGMAYLLAARYDEALAVLRQTVASWEQLGREPPGHWRPPLSLAEARASAPDHRATTDAVRTWIETELATPETEDSRLGETAWTAPSQLLLIAHPASVVADDPESAALIAASALQLMTDDRFGGWKASGEIDRLRSHLDHLPEPESPVPATPHDLLVLLTETFGASHLPEPPSATRGTT